MRARLRNVCLALGVVAVLLFGGVSPSVAADNPSGAGKPSKKPLTVGDLINFEFLVIPPEVKRGEVLTLIITGTPKPGYHTYPMTQRSDDKDKDGVEAQSESQLTTLHYGNAPAFKPLWPVTESTPEWVNEPGVGSLLEFKHKFTWSQDILVLPDAKPGLEQLPLDLKVQVCEDEGSCRTGTLHFEVPVQISEAPAVPLTAALQKRLEASQPAIKVLSKSREVPKEVSPPTPAGPPKTENPGSNDKLAKGDKTERGKSDGNEGSQSLPAPLVERKDSSLWGLLLASMGAAIAMLFTPCVFPMIPITVSFFLKQSEKEHHKPLATAGVYCLTIIVVLALAVLVLGQVIVRLANNPWLNLGLGLVLVFFALSLFGMYEIELPNFLARFTSTREGRGGYVGTFFMALTFTITSFTCTGPFLGPLLVTAKELQLSSDRLLLASLAYSATFAAPFFIMALFPSLLKALPRSGGWLNSVKVVMGFLELAAALKFLGNMDVALHPGNPIIFTFETVLCAWIALSLACGLYLLGLYRLPHDSPVTTIGVPRLVLATIFIGLALYMVPALFRKVPQGIVGEGLYAFLPLDTSEQAGDGQTASAEGRLDWHLDYQKAWEQATKEGKPIFIDFTGVNCTNCRANENRVFPRKEVREELAKFVRVQLYTDSVPKSGLTKDQAEAEARSNAELQGRMFEDVSTPMYVVFYPDKDRPFDGDRLSGEVADPAHPKYAGFIRDPADFVSFLKNARRKQVAQAAR
jgi:thiol:disulfide interchange protein DsbD